MTLGRQADEFTRVLNCSHGSQDFPKAKFVFFYRSFPEEKQKIASAFINLTNFKARRCQKVHSSNPERDFVQSFFYVSVIFEAK